MEAMNFTESNTTASVAFMDECKLPSLSHPFIRRVVDSTKLTDSNSQSESLPDSVKCFSSASYSEDLKAESVIKSTDYIGVEPKARLNTSDDKKVQTECKTEYGMTKEENDRLCNMKEEEEESKEWQSVKMEEGDCVRIVKGHETEQEKARDEQKGKGVTALTCQTHKCENNGVNSEYGQQEGEELSTLVTACLLKQPRVLICRLKTTDISILVSQPPCSMASKDQGVRSHGRRHEVSALKGKCSLRQKGQVMTWKREMIGQLERPHIQLPASLENGIGVEATHNPPMISPRNQNTGQTVGPSSQVLACSQCPFVHTKEANLHQHMEKVHPEEFRRSLDSGGSGGQNPSNSGIAHPPEPPKAVPTPTESHTVTSAAHKWPWGQKNFKSPLQLTGHQQTWSKERTYQCSKCGKSLKTKSALRAHQRIHTGEWPYQCSVCGVGCNQPSQMIRHQRVHTGERPFQCSQCGNKFRYLNSLTVHQKTHSRESPYKCSHCGKNFKVKSVLRVHEQIHTGEGPYPCSQCGKNFSSKAKLARHYRTHTGERPYQCSLCGKNFSSVSYLKVHQETHPGDSPYQCSQCGKNFSSLRYLKVHQKTHTGEYPHQCSQCGKNFGSKSNLARHHRTHTGERPYHCSQCGRNFSSLSYLKVHQQIHSRESPYQCSQCGENFKSKSVLTAHKYTTHTKAHQRIYVAEFPYQCSQCGKNFRTKAELKVHQVVHTEERPYHCSQCGKSFKWRTVLRVHQRTHTGERPYRCTECEKSFTQLNHLQRHQKAHTK